MDRQSIYSWDWSAEDYGRHRAGFPARAFERFASHGIGLPGQAIVDLGTGTGTLARGFAARGARVVGVDVAQDSLRVAEDLASREGVSVRWVEAPAETTGLDAGFDVVSAGQCWHWFDRPRAAAEARRLLRPGGRLLIAHFDFLAAPEVRTAARVLRDELGALEYDPETYAGLKPAWLRDCATAGFVHLETFSFDVAVPYTRDGWRGRLRASNWLARLSMERRREVDRALEEAFRAHEGTFEIPHRVFAVMAVAPDRRMA
ncbi:MAG: class I SAM-dependent methyltransferase [Myxococcota bacterium]